MSIMLSQPKSKGVYGNRRFPIQAEPIPRKEIKCQAEMSLFVRRFMMNKMKIKCGLFLFLLLSVWFNTPLSAEGKVGKNFKLFLDVSTYAFEDFAFGSGAELRINKFVSIKSALDFPTFGGRIITLDGVFTFNASKKLKPFFTIGYYDYFFGGNDSQDNDAIKALTFGGGIEFDPISLGVRIASSEGYTSGYFYCSFTLLKF